MKKTFDVRWILRPVAATVVFAVLFFAARSVAFGAEPATSGAEKKINVAFYVGDGPRGSWYARWIQALDCSPEVNLFFIDGAGVMKGDLAKADVFVMAGGWAPTIYKSIGGEKGCEKLREFLRNGGGYIGTCAGSFFAAAEGDCGPHARIAPFAPAGKWLRGEGAAVAVKFGKRAEELTGIKSGWRKVNYYNGPLLVPSKSKVPEATGEIIAEYDTTYCRTGTHKTRMRGKGAIVAGTFGKGRTFLISFHPESVRTTHDIVSGGFKYLTGRKITFVYRHRSPGAIKVGMNGYFSGIETAEAFREMDRSGKIDIDLFGDSTQPDGVFDRYDAVVVGDGEGKIGKSHVGFDRFVKRGGKVFAWGNGTNHVPKAATVLKGGKEAHDAIVAAFAAEKGDPAAREKAAQGENAARKTRIGVFCGRGVLCAAAIRFAEMFARSPDVDLSFLDKNSVASGALDALDVFVVPGGSGLAIWNDIESVSSFERVREFVRGGGAYLGICAGAYIALNRDGMPGYSGKLVPFKPASPWFRGAGTELSAKISARGAAILGVKQGNRGIFYQNGPLMMPAKEIEGASAEIIARYNCQYVTRGSEKTAMRGKGAMAAGTYGKGKTFLFSNHPEMRRGNHELIAGAIKYLSGRKPTFSYKSRKYGAPVVGLCSVLAGAEEMTALAEIVADENADTCIVVPESIDAGMLDAVDAIVLPDCRKEGVSAFGGKRGKALEKFVKRGGKVFAWGKAAKYAPKGSEIFPSAKDAVSAVSRYCAGEQAANAARKR